MWVVPEKSPKQLGSILSLTSALSLDSARASPRCHPPSPQSQSRQWSDGWNKHL